MPGQARHDGWGTRDPGCHTQKTPPDRSGGVYGSALTLEQSGEDQLSVR